MAKDFTLDDFRRQLDLITSRCLSRIAATSGTHPRDVQTFLAQFQQVRTLMRQMAGMSFWQRLKMVLGFRKPRPKSSFIRYFGGADFHDLSILAVEQEDCAVRVRVRGANGKIFVVEFSGVCNVRANHPDGMM